MLTRMAQESSWRERVALPRPERQPPNQVHQRLPMTTLQKAQRDIGNSKSYQRRPRRPILRVRIAAATLTTARCFLILTAAWCKVCLVQYKRMRFLTEWPGESRAFRIQETL